MATYTLSSENQQTSFKLIERPIYGSARLGIDNYSIELVSSTFPTNNITSNPLGLKQYELTNHLGNVLTTISDNKLQTDANIDGTIDYYTADITSASDYYPFGSLLDGRSFEVKGYRWGFNGKEKDNEWYGESSGALDFGARIYDPRLGRFFSVDPKVSEFPFMSPYCFAANSSIAFEDLNGEGPILRIFNRIFGQKSKTFTVSDYKNKWEEKHEQPMTTTQESTLARGCIGITCVNLGSNGLPNPPLDNMYSTFRKAKKEARILKQDIKENPSKYPVNAQVEIFSKRFYTNNNNAFLPDKEGKVDMTGYNYQAKSGFVNFDYGYYDKKTGMWWHANHSEPGMKVYRSKLRHFSRPLLDFNRQAFGVTISTL